MFKFFRRIRQGLLAESKFRKYLVYAFGEIVLVVIGILIALQLNTCNAKRIENKALESTYARVLEEINDAHELASRKIVLFDTLLLEKNKRSLYLMQLKNSDSVSEIFTTIKAVSNVVIVSEDMPATSEFLNNRNLSEVKSTELKTLFLRLKRSLHFAAVIDSYAKDQLNTLIEPYIIKNLNYAQMIGERDMMVINPLQDYTVFFNNLELENLINLKIETDHTKIEFLKSLETILNDTAIEIEKELNKE
jgi:hypothetical protein